MLLTAGLVLLGGIGAFKSGSQPEPRQWAAFYQTVVGIAIPAAGALYIRAKHRSSHFSRLWADNNDETRREIDGAGDDNDADAITAEQDRKRAKRRTSDVRVTAWIALVTVPCIVAWSGVAMWSTFGFTDEHVWGPLLSGVLLCTGRRGVERKGIVSVRPFLKFL